MCSPTSIFERVVVWVLVVAILAPASAAAAQQSGPALDRNYEGIVRAEQHRSDPAIISEKLASGIATLTIGMYGYYNDNRGPVVRMVYGAAQTAGILITSNAIIEANRPSLLLTTDKHMDRYDRMSYLRFKRSVVAIERQRAVGINKQMAYSGAILSTMYLYNGYREELDGLRNTFYFLGFNFGLISAAGFYRLATGQKSLEAPRYEIAVGPVTSVTWFF